MAYDLRASYISKISKEIDALEKRGMLISGNITSSILIAKGLITSADINDGLLFGKDGEALRASFVKLGYAPENWNAFSTCGEDRNAFSSDVIRGAMVTLDPELLIICDDASQMAIEDAYGTHFNIGQVHIINGIRMLALGGFESALITGELEAKKIMWNRLKKVPPLGAPF